MNTPDNNPTANTGIFSKRAALLCLAAFLAWGFILVRKYIFFGYEDWDLAFFAQAMWNLRHGSQYVSLFDINFFGNHSNLIALICLPVYIIFMHPLTLIFLKLLSFICAGYVLFLIAQPKIGETLSLLVLLLYLIYPPNIFGLLYEFDFESLAPIFLTLLNWQKHTERWVCASRGKPMWFRPWSGRSRK